MRPWRRALLRKVPPVTNRLRTLLAAPDGRLFVATPQCVSALHSAVALSTCAAAPAAVAHQLVFSPRASSSASSSSPPRKDTALHLSDVTSLALLHDALLVVLLADGALHLVHCRSPQSPHALRSLPVAPPSDLNAVCSTRLFAPSPPDLHSPPPFQDALVVARASGVHLYLSHALLHPHVGHVAPHHRLTDKWSAVLACCHTVPLHRHPHHLTVIAVAHEHGHLAVYSAHATPHLNQPVKSDLVWTLPLHAPISSLSFCSHSARASALSLLVAVGNGLVLVEWGHGDRLHPAQWHTPNVVQLEHAHQSLVSAVQLVADGSVLSAATDGCVLQWHIPAACDHPNQTAPNAQCTVVVQQQPDAVEPIMSAAATLNAFGAFVLTTSLRSRTEVGEPSKGHIRKYLGSGRRSSISLFMLPMTDSNVDAIDIALGKCIDRFLSPAWIGRPINMWDVHQFVSHAQAEIGAFMQQLYQRFVRLYETHESVESSAHKHHVNLNSHPPWLRQQRAMVLLQLCTIVTSNGTNDVDEIEQLTTTSVKLRKFLLCMHYDKCIRLALQRDDNEKRMEAFSEREKKALESMCEFVSICSAHNCESEAMQARVVEVRGRLQTWMANGGSARTLCPVCECEEVHTPLVADSQQLMMFFCEAGELFVRCVKSGLPCLDVVPLLCVGCGARAAPELFEWIDGGNKCSLCNCEMVASSVENVCE